jgi:hypothetical protein
LHCHAPRLTWANTPGRGGYLIIFCGKVDKASSWTPTSTSPEVNTHKTAGGAICDEKNVSISAIAIRNRKRGLAKRRL